MKNKKIILWILLTIVISSLIGFLISKFNSEIILIAFIPGIIVTLISQGVFKTEGAESIFSLPEVIITTYLFWLLLPLLLAKFIKKEKTENIKIRLFGVLSITTLIGVMISILFFRAYNPLDGGVEFTSLFEIVSFLFPLTFFILVVVLSVIVYRSLKDERK